MDKWINEDKNHKASAISVQSLTGDRKRSKNR